MENDLGTLVGTRLTNISLARAEFHTNYGVHEEIAKGRIKTARTHYWYAVQDLILAREYESAYELAEEKHLLRELKRILIRRTKPNLAKNSMYDDLVRVEALMENPIA